MNQQPPAKRLSIVQLHRVVRPAVMPWDVASTTGVGINADAVSVLPDIYLRNYDGLPTRYSKTLVATRMINNREIANTAAITEKIDICRRCGSAVEP
jgi:hypothetical protein